MMYACAKTSATVSKPLVQRASRGRTRTSVNVNVNVRASWSTTTTTVNKRELMSALLLSAAAAALPAAPASAKQATRTAGDFCPPSSRSDGYVRYTPDARATPSIRAGVIPGNYYNFDLPANWSEGTILNILSGNFCMPKCDEPWVETIWESKADGFCQLVVSPVYRLVSKANATVRDLGTPEGVIESLGAFITGNYLDSSDDAEKITIENFSDGREYYVYEINAPYAKVGSRFGAAVTVKDDLVYLFVVGATEKQWSAGKDALMDKTLRSFKA